MLLIINVDLLHKTQFYDTHTRRCETPCRKTLHRQLISSKETQARQTFPGPNYLEMTMMMVLCAMRTVIKYFRIALHCFLLGIEIIT